eukprot:403359403
MSIQSESDLPDGIYNPSVCQNLRETCNQREPMEKFIESLNDSDESFQAFYSNLDVPECTSSPSSIQYSDTSSYMSDIDYELDHLDYEEDKINYSQENPSLNDEKDYLCYSKPNKIMKRKDLKCDYIANAHCENTTASFSDYMKTIIDGNVPLSKNVSFSEDLADDLFRVLT